MLLNLRNLKKYYPQKNNFLGQKTSYLKAVDNVSFDVNAGENLSLVGESGCGKTTVARMIMKLIPIDSGQIIFDKDNITHLSLRKMREFRTRMQMVFQDPYSSLDPRFTIKRILQEAMVLQKKQYPSREIKEKRMAELLNAVDLKENILNRYPHEFSGGERQRIAIARALVMNPKLLILDEAVSSLDVIIQKQLIDLFCDLQKRFGLTYLFITHNLRVARKISQKIAVMYKGKIVELGTCDDIFQNPLHLYTKVLLSAAIDYKSVRYTKIETGETFVCKENDHWVME